MSSGAEGEGFSRPANSSTRSSRSPSVATPWSSTVPWTRPSAPPWLYLWLAAFLVERHLLSHRPPGQKVSTRKQMAFEALYQYVEDNLVGAVMHGGCRGLVSVYSVAVPLHPLQQPDRPGAVLPGPPGSLGRFLPRLQGLTPPPPTSTLPWRWRC